MNVVDFLTQPVVDPQLIVPRDSQFFGDFFGRLTHPGHHPGRRLLEIWMLLFGHDQKMNRGLGAVVRENDHVLGFVKYPGRDLPVNDSGKH